MLPLSFQGSSSFIWGNKTWNCLIPHSDDWRIEVASRALTTTCWLPTRTFCPEFMINSLLARWKAESTTTFPPVSSNTCSSFSYVPVIRQGAVMHRSRGIKPTNPYCPIDPKNENVRHIMAMHPAIIKIDWTLSSFVDCKFKFSPSRVPQTSGREGYFAMVACW